MAKLKVGIGLTTYEDVRSPKFGHALYQAMVAASPKLAPYRVDTLVDRHAVNSPLDFASHWCSEVRLVTQPKYGVAPSYVAPSDIGGRWKTKGTLPGDGAVCFAGRDSNVPSTLTLEHNYSARVGWAALFRQLVELFRPAQANLHIFTERELECAGDNRFAFRGPIVGEEVSTYWKDSLGHWRGPDPWEVAARRRYRFLPNLAWGNYLGSEFAGGYDRTSLIEHSTAPAEIHGGILFHVTEDLHDVVGQASLFEDRRARLRTTFSDDVFRLG